MGSQEDGYDVGQAKTVTFMKTQKAKRKTLKSTWFSQ